MREIPLTQDQVALVDDDVYDYLVQWKWHAWYSQHTRSYYARRGKNTIYMHRAILEYHGDDLTGLVVDHKNHETLDNQKTNLSPCTQRRNRQNNSPNKSGYPGVHFEKDSNKYKAHTRINGILHSIGRYSTAEEASKARINYLNMRGIK